MKAFILHIETPNGNQNRETVIAESKLAAIEQFKPWNHQGEKIVKVEEANVSSQRSNESLFGYMKRVEETLASYSGAEKLLSVTS